MNKWIIKLKPLFIAIVLLLIAGIYLVYGMDTTRCKPQGSRNEIIDAVLPSDVSEPSRAERVTKALAAAYPRRILKAEYRNGDWAVLLRDTWFYYAEGRLLPEDRLDRVYEYNPILFYTYQYELPLWETPSAELVSQIRNMRADYAEWLPRPNYFFDALYRAHNRSEADERVKTILFLGYPVTVHYSILENLALVEQRIFEIARTDPQTKSWIDSINNLESWGWRDVAGTQARSFHSYGVAIDILPRSPGSRAMYWQWAGPEWWNIPYERRYHPPVSVIKAFESYGFFWGGYWLFFDTMHFEYRPEIFILNGIDLSSLW